MAAFQHLRLCYLPDDMIRSIFAFCDWDTRNAVRCTNSALKSFFLGNTQTH